MQAQYAGTQIGAKINGIQKQIGAKKKAKEDANELLQQKADMEKEKQTNEGVVAQKLAALTVLVKTVGNYVGDTVPVSQNEDDNKIEITWAPKGFSKEHKPKLSHHEVLLRLDGYDPERGVKLAGHRGYCLTGYGMFLYGPTSALPWLCLILKPVIWL